MANPFKKTTKNATESKKVYGTERAASETETKKCKGCGAARPADTNLTICDYCGYKFMAVDVEIRINTEK